jgi:hypothetical protein
MKNKNLWLGILALVVGMTVIGCDNGNNNLPESNGNPLSGKTYYDRTKKIVFSVTANNASDGTYTVDSRVLIFIPELFEFVNTETGTYSWNEGAKTVTLKPERATWPIYITVSDYPLLDKTGFRLAANAFFNEMEEAGDDVKGYLLSKGFSNTESFINTLTNETFADTTKTYSFSTDKSALFLDDALPENNGTDEFSGQTYYGVILNSDTDTYEKNPDKIYVFTSYGYASIWNLGPGQEIYTGNYTYDSDQKRVWLKPLTFNGLDRNAYYAKQTAYPGHYYDNDYACRAAETIDAFRPLVVIQYDSTEKTMIKFMDYK